MQISVHESSDKHLTLTTGEFTVFNKVSRRVILFVTPRAKLWGIL